MAFFLPRPRFVRVYVFVHFIYVYVLQLSACVYGFCVHSRTKASDQEREGQRDDVGFSCSYFKHTCYELVLIKCVRIQSHTQSQLHKYNVKLSCFQCFFFSRSICVFFFIFEWKKTCRTRYSTSRETHAHTDTQNDCTLTVCAIYF